MKLCEEVNEDNDTRKVLDLHAQKVGNAKYIVKKKIDELDKIYAKKGFNPT